MKLPKLKPYLKKFKVYSNGTSPIYISVTKDRKQNLISVGYSIPHAAWDETNGGVYETKPKISANQKAILKEGEIEMLREEYSKAKVLHNAKAINQEIKNKLAEITLLLNKERANEGNLESKNIKKKFDVNPDFDRTKNFILYGESIKENLLNAGKIGTYKRYKTNLKKLKNDYIKNKTLSFSDINVEFLNGYEAYLQKEGLKTNSIHNNLKTIRAIYYRAIKEEIIPQDKNPFFTFKLKTDRYTRKEKLNSEEIKAIENLELEVNSLTWHCRNFFIFSFNVAGIRIGDFIQLKWSNINDGRLVYQMDKTGGIKSILMKEKATKILSYYTKEGVKLTDYIFPILSNDVDYSDPLFLFNQVSAKTALINKYLKKIATSAKIEKKLTTHIARHSFSDIARKKNVSIHDIKNLLGHSSVNTTEAYLSSFDYESQDASLNKILE